MAYVVGGIGEGQGAVVVVSWFCCQQGDMIDADKDGKIWNGKKYNKDGNVISTFVSGEEKNDYLFP